MPIYEYECQNCGYRSETMQRVNDPPLSTCPECGGEYKKLISPPALQFKGNGWYVTDYARKGKDDKEKAKEPDKKADAKGGDQKGSGDSGTKAKSGDY